MYGGLRVFFETALNEPMSNWDEGGANIERCFQVPRNPSQNRRQKRESEIYNFNDTIRA